MQNTVAAASAAPVWLQKLTQHPIVQKIFDAKHIPLLYSVIAVTSIFYHYGAEYTPLWFFFGLILQLGAFRLLRFVQKHNILGGALYVVVCVFTFLLAGLCISVGGNHDAFGGMFAPVGTDVNLSFMVWFLTPQSVINAFYGPYTVALFLLFTLFIATITYYYSHVIYRTLMSFSVMCFPFAIYAKESETMPVPFIVALFVMYFVVMIYCKQLHCGNEKLMHAHDPEAEHYQLPEPELLTHARVKELIEMPRPELFGKGIWSAAALFVGAAAILVLILPKPSVTADRGYLDTLLDSSAISDYLLNAISGFNDSSDGGGYSSMSSSQALYYVKAEENLNLRLSTYTYYDYETDSWTAGVEDKHNSYYDILYDRPMTLMAQDIIEEYDQSGYRYYRSENECATPYDYYAFFCMVEQNYPELAEEYGLTGISSLALDPQAYAKSMHFYAAMYNGTNYMAPLHTYMAQSYANAKPQLYHARNGLYFRTTPATQDVLYALDAIRQCCDRMARSANRRMELEMTLIRLCSDMRRSQGDVKALTERVAVLETQLAEVVRNGVRQAPSRQSQMKSSRNDAPAQHLQVDAAPSGDAFVLLKSWPSVLERFDQVNPSVSGLLQGSKAYVSDEKGVLLMIVYNRLFRRLFTAEDAKALGRAAAEITGKTYAIRFKCEEPDEAQTSAVDSLLERARSSGVEVADVSQNPI